MKKFLSLAILCFVLTTAQAQSTLTPESRVSLLTCGSGSELYALFGHTAIRVQDPSLHLDVVYNFGTFDFATPHFYLKFAKGALYYQLGASSYKNFYRSYQRENRTITEQVLTLTPEQRQKVFDYLNWKLRPENRTYLYNFLFDNCCTRVRDIMEKYYGEPILWNLEEENLSYWNLLDRYLTLQPWAQTGVHLILGQSGNRKASTREYMFLPDYLSRAAERGRTESGKRLAEPAHVLFQAEEKPLNHTFWNSPLFILAMVYSLFLLYSVFSRNAKAYRIVTTLLFALFGILGLLLLFMSLFTLHPITFPNFNLLWANPLLLILVPFSARREMKLWVRRGISIYVLLLASALILWFFFMPAVSFAVWPLILMLFTASIKLLKDALFA